MKLGMPIVIAILILAPVELVLGQGVLIPIPNRRDHVFDSSRNLLYITTSNGTVERYDVTNQSLLSPLSIGNSLNGVDITSDRQTLYVAEGVAGPTQGFVRKVNLNTGTSLNLTYNLDSGETGAWDVAIMNNGLAFFTTQFGGSGWNPMRQINLATDQISNRTDTGASGPVGEVRQNTHLSRGAARNLMFFQESNISSGPIHTYSAATNTFTNHANTQAFQEGLLAAVNRSGSLIAMEFGSGVSIMNSTLGSIQNLSNANAGVVFSPVADILFAGNATTDQIVAYSTVTWSPLFMLSIGENVTSTSQLSTGVMSISDDGQRLFMSTPAGVRMYTVPEPASLTMMLVLAPLIWRRGRR